MPSLSPSSARISVPSRAGALPSGLMPTRLRFGPFASSAWMRAAPGKPPSIAAPLLDRPGEAGFDRARGLVDVVAVEAEPRLEPQRVARAEPDRLHAVLRQQQLGEIRRLVGRDRDLEAVLAGVARARDVAVERADASRSPPVMNAKAGGIRRDSSPARRCAAGPCRAMRASSGAGTSLTLAGNRAREVRVVDLLAAGVDDQVKPPSSSSDRRPRHHQIVDDAAVVVEELGVALLAGLQIQDVGRHQRSPAPPRWSRDPARSGRPAPCARRRTGPAAARVCRCSFRMPSGYCTGIS